MDLNELCWHDGNITKIEIINKGDYTNIYIGVDLYDDPEVASKRTGLSIECLGVTRFNSTCDFIEIQDNSKAGSIIQASEKDTILNIHLFGGYIEIQAKNYNCKKC